MRQHFLTFASQLTTSKKSRKNKLKQITNNLNLESKRILKFNHCKQMKKGISCGIKNKPNVLSFDLFSSPISLTQHTLAFWCHLFGPVLFSKLKPTGLHHLGYLHNTLEKRSFSGSCMITTQAASAVQPFISPADYMVTL